VITLQKNVIAILEEDHQRRVEMFRWLDDRLYHYRPVWFRTALEMIDWLRVAENHESLAVIGLDYHPDSDDEGSGVASERNVVDYLIAQPSDSFKMPVLIHTTNDVARTAMVNSLHTHGWPVRAVIPGDDISWIGKAWYSEVKAAIRDAAKTRLQSMGDSVPKADPPGEQLVLLFEKEGMTFRRLENTDEPIEVMVTKSSLVDGNDRHPKETPSAARKSEKTAGSECYIPLSSGQSAAICGVLGMMTGWGVIGAVAACHTMTLNRRGIGAGGAAAAMIDRDELFGKNAE
jgi:hypothetical protein